MNAVEADLLDKIGNSRVHPISPDRPGRYVAFEGNEQDPHPVYLPQGEVIVSMSPVEIRWPAPISPIEALMLVTKAQKVEDIGLHPVSAAACTPENAEKPELQLFSDTEFGRDEIIVAQDLIKDFPKTSNIKKAEYIRDKLLDIGNSLKNNNSGSTLTGFLSDGNYLFIFNVGDSQTLVKTNGDIFYFLQPVFEKGEYKKGLPLP